MKRRQCDGEKRSFGCSETVPDLTVQYGINGCTRDGEWEARVVGHEGFSKKRVPTLDSLQWPWPDLDFLVFQFFATVSYLSLRQTLNRLVSNGKAAGLLIFYSFFFLIPKNLIGKELESPLCWWKVRYRSTNLRISKNSVKLFVSGQKQKRRGNKMADTNICERMRWC